MQFKSTLSAHVLLVCSLLNLIPQTCAFRINIMSQYSFYLGQESSILVAQIDDKPYVFKHEYPILPSLDGNPHPEFLANNSPNIMEILRRKVEYSDIFSTEELMNMGFGFDDVRHLDHVRIMVPAHLNMTPLDLEAVTDLSSVRGPKIWKGTWETSDLAHTVHLGYMIEQDSNYHPLNSSGTLLAVDVSAYELTTRKLQLRGGVYNPFRASVDPELVTNVISERVISELGYYRFNYSSADSLGHLLALLDLDQVFREDWSNHYFFDEGKESYIRLGEGRVPSRFQLFLAWGLFGGQLPVNHSKAPKPVDILFTGPETSIDLLRTVFTQRLGASARIINTDTSSEDAMQAGMMSLNKWKSLARSNCYAASSLAASKASCDELRLEREGKRKASNNISSKVPSTVNPDPTKAYVVQA